MRAHEAGKYIADRLRLEQALSAQQMWTLARVRLIPVVRLGRKVFFLPSELDRYLDEGGAGYATRQATGKR